MGTIIGNILSINNNLNFKSLPKRLNAILIISDLNNPINGYFRDISGNNYQIQAATTVTANDSLIMPANNSALISALTLAGCYSVFYTTDSTPKTVKLSDILQNYGTNFYFDEWNKRKLCIFQSSLNTTDHNSMLNYINYVDWLFPTGTINFTQTIDFSKIFGKHQKI